MQRVRAFFLPFSNLLCCVELFHNAALGTVAAKDDADGIVYDQSTALARLEAGTAFRLLTPIQSVPIVAAFRYVGEFSRVFSER